MEPVSLGTQATAVFTLKLSFVISLIPLLIFLLILLYNIDILDFKPEVFTRRMSAGFIIIIFPCNKAGAEICILNVHGEHEIVKV